MKFICDKFLLQNACTTASRAAASKSPMQALEGLLIKTDGEGVTIVGYDLKKAISTSIESENIEAGAVVVNTRLLCEMIRRLPEGKVTFTSDSKDNVVIKCGKSEYNVIGIGAEDYPELPNIDELNGITLTQATLKKMISKTIFAVADNDLRPIYTGTLFDIDSNNLTLVSVDGYRLAKRTEIIEGSIDNTSFIVPGASLSDIEKICEDDKDKTVKISVGTKHISFTIGSTVVISRRLEGEFLDYKKSVPTNFKHEIILEKSELISTVDRVSLIISDKNTSPLRVTFNDNQIYCLCNTPLGKAEDTCECEGSGEGMEIGFNNKYVLDALKAAETDKIKICINTPNYPCVIKPADDNTDFAYMILPMRLKA